MKSLRHLNLARTPKLAEAADNASCAPERARPRAQQRPHCRQWKIVGPLPNHIAVAGDGHAPPLAGFQLRRSGLVPVERIERGILLVRGQKVILDRDLAALYGVETRVLNQAVRRNLERFPDDFMLVLSRQEITRISQSVTSSDLKFSKSVFAFTEQGVAMLSSVLNNPQAVQVNIEIMRAFVRLRQWLTSHADLARKLAALEGKYDKQFRMVFDAIRELMSGKKTPKREIGFHAAMPGLAKVRRAKPKKI